MLARLSRRFTLASADLPAPKGTVDWAEYAVRRLATGQALNVPCVFPDLRDDEALRSAVHFALREHRKALQAQRAGGLVVLKLLMLCEQLLAQVAGTQPCRPRDMQMESWRRHRMNSRVFREGLQAIEWTVDKRGLAGLSELAGLAWQLDMEAFFESWVETLADRVARTTGASLRVGRKEETRVALDWRPPHLGSQRSLVPDLVLQRPDCTLVIDAKYKSHAEELDHAAWKGLDNLIRERHRADLLQVLAYSTLYDSPRVAACLMYPCRPDTYESLCRRGQEVTRAAIPAGNRRLELVLATAPIGWECERTVSRLADVLLQPLVA